MAPMHLAAAEAGGASGKSIFAQEKGVVRAQRSEPRSLQKSALRRARGWPLSLCYASGNIATKDDGSSMERPAKRQVVRRMAPTAKPVRSRKAANRRAVS